MATKKKLLQAAAGQAGGAGGAVLNVEDVFSTYLYEGNGSSQVIENGINLGQSFGSGSGYFNGTSSYLEADDALDFHTSGADDITIEMFLNIDDGWTGVRCPFAINATDGSSNYLNFEVDPPSSGSGTFGLFSNAPSINETFGTYSVNTWHHVAITYDGSNLKVYKDGTLIKTHSWTASSGFSTRALNIGMETDGGDTPGNFYRGYISNFRMSNSVRYASNFTAPSSSLTSDANTELLTLQGEEPFGDNSSNSVSVTNTNTVAKSFGPFDAAAAGEGGLVWIKNRQNVSGPHYLHDSEMSSDINYLQSNSNSGLLSGAAISKNSNGFSIASTSWEGLNASGEDYASWTFRKAPKFFDVVTYTGDGTNGREISHDLGGTVGSIFVKKTNVAREWAVYHRSVGATHYGVLNNTDQFYDQVTLWNDTEPTSTHFTVGYNNSVNTNGDTYVAYLFAHNDGDGGFGPDGDADIIKCGSYSQSSASDVDVDLGFEPQFVIVKRSDDTSQWYILDEMRGFLAGSNSTSSRTLYANLTNAEADFTIQKTATGFTWPSGQYGSGTQEYIYIAIRRGTKVPESADEVFDISTYLSGDIYPSSITPDAALMYYTPGYDDGTYSYPEIYDRLRGKGGLQTSNTREEKTARTGAWDYMNSFRGTFASGAWLWKRAPGFFDVVAYSGDAVAGRTVSHNLGVAPEMILVKKRNAARSWIAYHSGIGSGKFLELDNNSAAGTVSTVWYDTDPTSTNFTVGTNSSVNQVPDTYIAYLFASLDGISKVGSFSHAAGTPTNVDCGFTNGARFVLWKKYNNTDGWQIYDTTRGIVAGNDPFFQINTPDAEITNQDLIDPLSSGFTVAAGKNSGDYIFYAIA